MPDIAIWNRCNSHCVMCTNPADFQKEDDSSSYTISTLQGRLKPEKCRGCKLYDIYEGI